MLDIAPDYESLGIDPAWDTAVPDWQARILGGRSLIPDLPLFDDVAEKALRIFKRLKVPDLPGTPTFGEICDDWVLDFVRVIFGSYDPDTKRRMLREFFLLVPKKNGKSAISAGIIVTAAIMNERPQAELLLIAPTQKIAGIAFKTARGIIALDDQLSKLFRVQTHQKQITHLVTEAVIMILSADGDVVTGSKGCYILVDETHVLGSKGPRKLEGHPYGPPIDDAARAAIEEEAEALYAMFTSDVAKSRGVPVSVVRADPEKAERHFGGGRTYRAKRAVALGMADRIATLEDTLMRAARGRPARRAALAAKRLAML